jgi:hypothetical protein
MIISEIKERCKEKWYKKSVISNLENLGTGFGFLTFESEESVDRCTGEHYVSINGKQVFYHQNNNQCPSPLLFVKNAIGSMNNQGSPLFKPRRHLILYIFKVYLENVSNRRVKLVFVPIYWSSK